jgi:hypothetical protein
MPASLGTLTSANCILFLSQPILLPTPVQIEQFAADDVYGVDRIKSVEVLMGVDGVLSGGFVFAEIMQHFYLQANSPSNVEVFDKIWTQMVAAKDVYPLNGSITLPAIKTKFTMSNGFLTDYSPAPDAKKILQRRQYTITWNSIGPSPA